MANLEEIAEVALKTIAGMTSRKPEGVIGIMKCDEGWLVEMELVEKESIPSSMDILGVYEVTVDDMGNLLKFRRKKLRGRVDTEQEE